MILIFLPCLVLTFMRLVLMCCSDGVGPGLCMERGELDIGNEISYVNVLSVT